MNGIVDLDQTAPSIWSESTYTACQDLPIGVHDVQKVQDLPVAAWKVQIKFLLGFNFFRQIEMFGK